MLLSVLDAAPRRVLLALCVTCIALLGFGLYLQHVVGLNPCPMCIVQRYALLLVAIIAGLTALPGRRAWHVAGVSLALLSALGGAFVAARQSWLQWYPPQEASCGRDLYGMIETFPLKRAIPMIFKGSGDCTAVDWTFLGGSLANWSFVVFCGIVLLCGLLIWRRIGAAT
jgi:disulfide bond formation protein DsbB